MMNTRLPVMQALMPSTNVLPNDKRLATGFSLLMLGAVLWPIIENWRTRPRDNFPLSYYPMFSARRAKHANVTYLVGIDDQGQRSTLSYKLAGMGGMNQVRRQMRRMVRKGRAATLCAAVAEQVAAPHRTSLAQIKTVQVVTGTYRLDDYFAGNPQPVREVVHAEQTITRRQACAG